MSTDTAFALGMLALVGPQLPDRVRTYLLTFAIVDDLVGTRHHRVRLQRTADLAAAAGRALVLLAVGAWCCAAGTCATARSTRCWASGAWVAFFESGVDPIVVGLLIGPG